MVKIVSISCSIDLPVAISKVRIPLNSIWIVTELLDSMLIISLVVPLRGSKCIKGYCMFLINFFRNVCKI